MKKLGQDFDDLKKIARENPYVKEYLDSLPVTIGNIVYARRLQLGYTQEKLAKLAKTTQRRISEIESGMGNTTMNVLDRVFKVLKLEKLELKFFDEEATSVQV